MHDLQEWEVSSGVWRHECQENSLKFPEFWGVVHSVLIAEIPAIFREFCSL